jgi:hypothetical protein
MNSTTTSLTCASGAESVHVERGDDRTRRGSLRRTRHSRSGARSVLGAAERSAGPVTGSVYSTPSSVRSRSPRTDFPVDWSVSTNDRPTSKSAEASSPVSTAFASAMNVARRCQPPGGRARRRRSSAGPTARTPGSRRAPRSPCCCRCSPVPGAGRPRYARPRTRSVATATSCRSRSPARTRPCRGRVGREVRPGQRLQAACCGSTPPCPARRSSGPSRRRRRSRPNAATRLVLPPRRSPA